MHHVLILQYLIMHACMCLSHTLPTPLTYASLDGPVLKQPPAFLRTASMLSPPQLYRYPEGAAWPHCPAGSYALYSPVHDAPPPHI